ncbi:MAG: hypothetical protein ACE5Q3_03465 [Alphaproteobacteria bacterium]
MKNASVLTVPLHGASVPRTAPDTAARAQEKWPLRRTILFVVTTCGAFWLAAILAGYRLVAHFVA